MFDSFSDSPPGREDEFSESSGLADFSGPGSEPAFFGLVDYFPEMTVAAGDEDAAIFSGFDAFYAHRGDGDGHVGIVESEGAVRGGSVYAEEEEGGACAEGEEVGNRGEEYSWTRGDETDC